MKTNSIVGDSKTPLSPHAMPHHLSHLNFQPLTPGPGYAVLMQGDHIVHQAKGIAGGERITLVNGYTYLDPAAIDHSALGQLASVDPESTVTAEYSRHMALRCQSCLDTEITAPDFDADVQRHIEKLTSARDELDRAIRQLQALKPEELTHFGD